MSGHTMCPEMFWAKVDKQGPILRPELGPCWLWTGGKDKDGYGQTKVKGVCTRAHRYAFYLKHGHYPKPCGLHRCDTPPCCNPEHIFEGTVSDNNKDARHKGRSRWINGSQVYNAKLTEVEVKQLRKRVAAGEVQRTLAREYGVCPAIVCEIISRKRWSHI
jgi:hypothetical protein